MHKTVELDIDDLKLDPINPRIEEQDSQLETLQSVIDDQGSKLGELTEDIALHGLSPMETKTGSISHSKEIGAQRR